jgi:preprotein translocase subunit YajC
MNHFTILAADPPKEGSPPKTSPLGNPLFFFGIIFVMMYFLIIRPQSKQRKEQAARVASVEKGDKIITIGGLHGLVHHVSDKTVTIKLSEGVFVPFEKEAIRTVNKLKSAAAKKDEEKEEPGAEPKA